jgi:predicted enzyme related to lactoylglutathione lyase
MATALLKAKLILVNVPTVNSDDARNFYNTLLGSEDFVRAPNDTVESYFRPLSEDGINLTLTRRYDDRETFTPYFAVHNLDEAIEELTKAGGELIVKPLEVQNTSEGRRGMVGRMVQMLDPDRNPVGLMELDESVHGAFRWGTFQRSLQPDQVEGLEVAKESY